jgi:predicted nucleotidyltransferase component of viral defense system
VKERNLKNMAASVRSRLLNIARQSGKPFDQLLFLYGQERFLFRLSQTVYKEKFVLKGGLLLVGLGFPQVRPTRDIDLLGLMNSNVETISSIMREIVNKDVDDGLKFNLDELTYEIMSPDSEYPSFRFKFMGNLGQAKIPMQVDVGFGDQVVPAIKEIEFPTLLDMEPPIVLVYSIESVVAEKFEAALDLADLNSRMKDFYDIWTLSRSFAFDGKVLQEAIIATCSRRQTTIETQSQLFSDEFANQNVKQTQWEAFVRKGLFKQPPEAFTYLMGEIRSFLFPLTESIEKNKSFNSKWTPGGTWVGKDNH